MSERHFHGTTHFKGGFDAIGQELTPAEKIAIKREVIKSLEASANDFPQFAAGLLARVKVIEAEIADLQIEADNLSACVPAGWIEDAEADAAEYAADVQERADLYALGMGR